MNPSIFRQGDVRSFKAVVCHMTTKITSLGGLERNA